MKRITLQKKLSASPKNGNPSPPPDKNNGPSLNIRDISLKSETNFMLLGVDIDNRLHHRGKHERNDPDEIFHTVKFQFIAPLFGIFVVNLISK